jgi:hypothetical protein
LTTTNTAATATTSTAAAPTTNVGDAKAKEEEQLLVGTIHTFHFPPLVSMWEVKAKNGIFNP